MITIDGSFGEGGGQILRTSVGLSLATGKPFQIENIRAGREKPGLRTQHLTAVTAAAEIAEAEVTGAEIGSQELAFIPGEIKPGDYSFSVGTAGSTGLVLQTILPALVTSSAPSHLTLRGGTHNPWTPPFDFLQRSFVPLMNCMGPTVELRLDRYGFYPAGGGSISVEIAPAPYVQRLDLMKRGRIRNRRGRALIANLPLHIAEREVKVLKKKLSWDPKWLSIEPIDGTAGPGNVVMIELEYEHVMELFTAFGRKGVRAENVAGQVVREVRRYLKTEAPVGQHLADQLLVPIALAGSGTFKTLPLTQHSLTNIDVIKQFLEVDIVTSETGENEVTVEIHGR